MNLHSVLTAASTVVHPHSPAITAAQLATTLGAGAVGVVLLRTRQRLRGARAAVPVGSAASRAGRSPRSAARETAPGAAHPSVALTCRPQLLTPPGTERARSQVEVWRERGELDPETYLDLQRVIADVESATRV